jgi:tripartite-type tricarboxylate transporter receptor subunit TctC
MDIARDDDERRMVAIMQAGESVGHGFFVSPSVPMARVEALRKAFDATMKDAAFLADAEKRRQVVEPVSGAELDRTVSEATSASPALIAKMRKFLSLDSPAGKK